MNKCECACGSPKLTYGFRIYTPKAAPSREELFLRGVVDKHIRAGTGVLTAASEILAHIKNGTYNPK